MGTVTSGRFGFFKPDPTDYVDPVIDMDNNFNIIDSKVRDLIRYRSDVAATITPAVVEDGYKTYYRKNGQVQYSVSGVYHPSPNANNVETWNTITTVAPFAAGTTNNSVMQYCQWRYLDSSHTGIELKGRLYASAGTFTNNSLVRVTADAAIPNTGGYSLCFNVMPSVTTNNPTVAANVTGCVINITPAGALWICHYGANANHVDNYVCLDGVKFYF